MLLRIRLSSFLAGVAVAGTFSLYQIRQDIQRSHELLSAQVRSTTRRTRAFQARSAVDVLPVQRSHGGYTWCCCLVYALAPAFRSASDG